MTEYLEKARTEKTDSKVHGGIDEFDEYTSSGDEGLKKNNSTYGKKAGGEKNEGRSRKEYGATSSTHDEANHEANDETNHEANDEAIKNQGRPPNKTVRMLTQRLVEAIISELNRDEMKRCVNDRVITPLIDIMNQENTKKRVNDHIIGPLIRLMYTQMFPYLIIAAIILLSGLIMWVLMFTMFALTYFRK